MKKTLLIYPIVFSAIFAGCTTSPTEISQNQIFQGYPCRDNCQNFKSGFESAKSNDFTQDESCANLPQSLQLGCLSYLHEYRLEHNLPGGYSFPTNN